jgi:hypothetical protein
VCAVLWAALLLAAALIARGPAAGSTPTPESGGGALLVVIETIVVDRHGTWSAGVDEAEIFPGGTGVLEKSTTLTGRRGPYPRHETVRLTSRVTPSWTGTGGCELHLVLEARTGAATAEPTAIAARKTTSLTLEPDEERLVEAYASPLTDGRLALKIRCDTARPPAVDTGRGLIDFDLSIERTRGDEAPEPLRSGRLRAGPGRDASLMFSLNVPLQPADGDEERYRREIIEVRLSPGLIVGGLHQVEVTRRGELATVWRGGRQVRHPLDTSRTLVLSSGQPQNIDLAVPSAGPHEGWDEVRYRIVVTGRF